MARDDTIFEREELYFEVWKEPVRIVTTRYGISDVGLRKICKKLAVPMPPLGYWAKLVAGKKPRIVPMQHDCAGQTRYAQIVARDIARECGLLARDECLRPPSKAHHDYRRHLRPLLDRQAGPVIDRGSS